MSKENKMIEKLDIEPTQSVATNNCIINKINTLVDAVNELHEEAENNARIRANHEHKIEEFQAKDEEIAEWIDILEAVRKSVNKLETMAKNTNTVLESLVQENNIHEKQIDELQMKVEPKKCKAPADQYAEQRRWIGKLCRFWNINKDNSTYEILEKVVTDWPCRFKEKGNPYLWEHCELVKPDDDIIYKGE